MDERNRARIEDRRQIEHIVPVVFAFLLPYLEYWFVVFLAVLAVGYALYVSPRLLKVTTRAEEKAQGFSAGKLLYALSILGLLLIFRDQLYLVASVWGILAFGDAFSNLIGRRLPLFSVPYNRKKSLGGFLAFWVTGSLGGWVLLLWNGAESLPADSWTLLWFSCVTSFFCAVVESLPPVLDDNFTIAWIGALSHFLLFSVASAAPVWEGSWQWALAVNLAAVVVARLLNWLSWRGTALAFGFGVLTYCSMGLGGFAVIAGFLILGSWSTRLGFEHKRRLKIAQGKAGERGIVNILSNGFVPLTIALFYPWVQDSFLKVALAAAAATAALDTVGTEVGQWLGKHPFDPVTLRRVPVGTKGAMSVEGTAAGLFAALLIACTPPVLGWLPPSTIPWVLVGALAGALFESILASRFKYRFAYSDEALNLLSTLFGAMVAGVLV